MAAKPGNPFSLPKGEELFLHRDAENAAMREEKARLRQMTIKERTAHAGGKSRRAQLKRDQQAEELAETRAMGNESLMDQRLSQRNVALEALAVNTRDRRVEKDQLADYISKKREMFLIRYALDVKKDEMQRLEEAARQEERTLEDAEAFLEADASKFDQFLKENDRNAVEAIEKAEAQTKLKQARTGDIKRLEADRMAVSSDLSKQEDTLLRLQEYRDFLHLLSPQAWLDTQKTQREQRRAARRAAAAEAAAAGEAAADRPPSRPGSARRGSASLQRRRSFRRQDSADTSRVFPLGSAGAGGRRMSATLRRRNSARSNADQEELEEMRARIAAEAERQEREAEEEEPPQLFFSDPAQVLDIFGKLEAENLSLIQNGQESEEGLHDLQERVKAEQERIAAELAHSEAGVSSLQDQIQAEQDRIAHFKRSIRFVTEAQAPATKGGRSRGATQRTAASKGKLAAAEQESAGDKEILALDKRVAEAYGQCIGENDANIDTVQMLANLETLLEELFEKMERMPPDELARAEKGKDKERRLRQREAKIQAQKAHQEMRMKKALERSQQAPKKQNGRKLVYRSQPPARPQRETKTLTTEEEEELKSFFT